MAGAEGSYELRERNVMSRRGRRYDFAIGKSYKRLRRVGEQDERMVVG